MTSRYTRPASPRGRYSNPARSSTGTFDPYYDSNYYGRPSSPRASVDRIGGYSAHTYNTPSNSISSRTTNLKYDSYSGRPRRNTLTESDDRGGIWPNVAIASTTALPVRTHTSHGHHDRPSSPLTRTWDNRDTYITHGNTTSTPHRREHKRIYSVDDSTHTAKLVAEKDYSLTSGGRTYHSQHKPSRSNEVGDESFSYTDPASMYRDTEPAWRRPRANSIERSSRPTSMIVDRAPRTSTRDLGPPPSTRGFDKINSTAGKTSSRHRGRSPSLERPRDVPKYDAYPEPLPPRPASTSYHGPAIHQSPIHQTPLHQTSIHQDPRREAYRADYGRSDRDVENRRYAPVEQLDPDVSKRGFGIASPIIAPTHDATYDRQPPYQVPEPPRTRPVDHGNQYYSTDRADARIPEPRMPRERDVVPTYDERPRDRDHGRREKDHVSSSSAIPTVAGAAAGAAATLGAAGLLKSRNKEREERERERELEKEREQRREWDERDRRDRVAEDRRDDRRDRAPEERRERGVEDRRERDRTPEKERLPPPPPPPAAVAPAYAPIKEAERKPRERHYEDDERDRRSRKTPSSEGSDNERPRHYVDPTPVSERRKDPAPKEAALDPDEEYRRRIQLEAERSGRAQQRDRGDSDREKERPRRREDRDKSRDRSDDTRSRGAPSTVAEPPQSRYDDRPAHVLDAGVVQEPEPIAKEQQQQSGRSVQIVTPPKEPAPQPKGILRKPTEKFPEEPEPIREGVAPHKSQMKGKDIPINARWTKIDRKLVNPEALEEAKERFEERLDCVIVLRVLTKSEIQKLADRTRAIREAREDEYDRHDRDDRDRDDDRDRRSRRSHRDDDDRDRRRDYDSDMDDLGRDRDRSRDRPRMIEAGR